ncbi:galactitol-1-phosphate 5-dehydrogenase [Catenuloplanes japonicus]|uniref:galactitol-1-phosphate 5-dehydrogenase n=1 Tax=Catenuloplanes japonicus TaxID=33876 RepID=UPI000AD49EBA|nr:galactitol-1-phosphate 5-dehydrogenase [Catenuloplanes japonicus]
MSTTMRAVVLHAPGDIRVESVAIPEPKAGEALVKVAACGVCGSDIARMLTKGAHRLPLICGHEFSGYIEALGPGVSGYELGELVSVPPMIPCFACGPCQKGSFSLCEDYDYFGSRRDGAYAQYVAVPVSNLMKLPEGLDPVAAAMLDPAAIALHAVWRTKLRANHRVGIVGAGPIGLFAVQWARLAGASEVVSIDLNAQKAAMAIEAGATSAVSSPEEARDAAGDGFDVIIESAGVPAAEDMAVALAARHGDVAFIGIPNAPVTLGEPTFARFLRNEISMHGAWNSFSAPFPGDEWRTSAVNLANGQLKWKFMVTHDLPLDAVPETIRALGDRSIFSSKVIFRPNGE